MQFRKDRAERIWIKGTKDIKPRKVLIYHEQIYYNDSKIKLNSTTRIQFQGRNLIAYIVSCSFYWLIYLSDWISLWNILWAKFGLSSLTQHEFRSSLIETVVQHKILLTHSFTNVTVSQRRSPVCTRLVFLLYNSILQAPILSSIVLWSFFLLVVWACVWWH